MMHLMATNICVLIVTAVMETNEDYRQQNYSANNTTTRGKTKLISAHVIPIILLFLVYLLLNL